MVFKKYIIGFLISFVIVFIVAFFNGFFHTMYRNKAREKVIPYSEKSVGYITAIVNDEFRVGRGFASIHYAAYEFNVNKVAYTGQTFFQYKGVVGDAICLLYNKSNPKENIYCNDSKLENYTQTVISAFATAAILLVFLVMFGLLKFYWKKLFRK